MADPLPMINSPVLTKLIEELQKGFAIECQKNLDVQRSRYEQRIQMLEAELVVERKRRIQAEALCKALRELSNQPRLDNLSLFLSSVAEFADELKSMVHTMYTVAPNDPAIYTDAEPEVQSCPNPPSQSAVSAATNDDQQISSDDGFVPASKLPDPSHSMQIDSAGPEPFPPTSESRETASIMQHVEMPQSPRPPVSTSTQSATAATSSSTTGIVNQNVSPSSIASVPRFPAPSQSSSMASPLPSYSAPEIRTMATSSSSQGQRISPESLAPHLSAPPQFPTENNKTSSSQDLNSIPAVADSPRPHSFGNGTAQSTVSPAIVDTSPISLEKEVVQLLQTKSSSTCCDVKTIPTMYASRYGQDFTKRLVEVGLSSLETFVNYFRWQSHLGKTSLTFTERVLDNQTRIFVSVQPQSTKGASSIDAVKQEQPRSRPRSPSNSPRDDSSEVGRQSPKSSPLHLASNSAPSSASTLSEDNPNSNLTYPGDNSTSDHNPNRRSSSRPCSPEQHYVESSKRNSHPVENHVSTSRSASLERRADPSSKGSSVSTEDPLPNSRSPARVSDAKASSFADNNQIPSTRSRSSERQVWRSRSHSRERQVWRAQSHSPDRRRSDSRYGSPHRRNSRDVSPSAYRRSHYDSSDRYDRSESRGYPRSRSSAYDTSRRPEDIASNKHSLDDIHSFCYYFNKSNHCQRVDSCKYIHACKRCQSFNHGECSCTRSSSRTQTIGHSPKPDLNFRITVGTATIDRN